MNKLPLFSSQCLVRCRPWSFLCWTCLNFQSSWILSTFPFVQQFYFYNRFISIIIILFLLFFSCCWPLRCSFASSSSFVAAVSSPSASFFTMSFSLFVHIPYSPSSCYTIKRQYHVRSTAFLQVHLVLLPQVLIQRCIILKLYFSKINSPFIIRFWEIF